MRLTDAVGLSLYLTRPPGSQTGQTAWAPRFRGYGEGSRRELRVREPRLKDMSNTNEDGVRHAIAARERGRGKVRTATTVAAVSSVAAAGGPGRSR